MPLHTWNFMYFLGTEDKAKKTTVRADILIKDIKDFNYNK